MLKKLVEEEGTLYSELLGIDVKAKPFRWFLAAILFGAPIGEKIAMRTYKMFEEEGLLTPQKILDAGWDKLVEVLDKGGYVRYDFKTATKLLEVCKNLVEHYGSLEELACAAKDTQDLQQRLTELGKGIGKGTVAIFLRELYGVWDKAIPQPSEKLVAVMKRLEIGNLVEAAAAEGIDPRRLECALFRLSKNFCKKRRCQACVVRARCSANATIVP
jgi:endonuclease III